MTQPNLREYKAIIRIGGRPNPGFHVTVMATDREEAYELLEKKHGPGTVFDLHNEDDAVTLPTQRSSDMAQKKLKEYRAIIEYGDPNRPDLRVTVMAVDGEEAFNLLEEKYGKGTVFDLHNEEEANTIR
ncbi:hypothetical protein LXT21_12505 [Myxococcus sp. K38C18041901]|uniref:hypothetical protein n=1 Tax=Myxococcus guangdongensis TaxID=2906760 RepID=UPI0020A70627|nr:hypothetical protein [Myxococcus guangdongensis]MCP3059599.1 hypothetical protein [Myxococcus guangdongensis]